MKPSSCFDTYVWGNLWLDVFPCSALIIVQQIGTIPSRRCQSCLLYMCSNSTPDLNRGKYPCAIYLSDSATPSCPPPPNARHRRNGIYLNLSQPSQVLLSRTIRLARCLPCSRRTHPASSASASTSAARFSVTAAASHASTPFRVSAAASTLIDTAWESLAPAATGADTTWAALMEAA